MWEPLQNDQPTSEESKLKNWMSDTQLFEKPHLHPTRLQYSPRDWIYSLYAVVYTYLISIAQMMMLIYKITNDSWCLVHKSVMHITRKKEMSLQEVCD